jgi:hypothetical protein
MIVVFLPEDVGVRPQVLPNPEARSAEVCRAAPLGPAEVSAAMKRYYRPHEIGNAASTSRALATTSARLRSGRGSCRSALQAEYENTTTHERRAQEVKRRHAFAEPKKRP